MKVILIKDVKGQGKKDDIIDVSNGYAQNFLIKNKYAVLYTDESKKVLERQIKQREDTENELVSQLIKVKNALNDKTIKFKVKTGKEDKVFGTISSKQIADSIQELGFKIDKKTIEINSPIDCLGNHIVKINLYKKVSFKINVLLEK